MNSHFHSSQDGRKPQYTISRAQKFDFYQVDTLIWSYLDKRIIAYDTSGAICAFHPTDGQKLMQFKPYSDMTFTDIAIADNNRTFLTAEDGILREVEDNKVWHIDIIGI